MNASRTMRAGGALGHLLLVAALVFGVFVMHTLGHPSTSSESHAMTAHTSGHASACDPATKLDGDQTGGPGGSHAAQLPQHGPETAPSAAGGTVTHCPGMDMDTDTGMGTGLDMTTLCLAVLTVWALGRLLHMMHRGRGRPPVIRVAAGADASRPDPPPLRPPALAMLSILRI